MTLQVRERPPTRLNWTVETPAGSRTRWGADEWKPENAPADATFSSTVPGGFEQHTVTLTRDPDRGYPDLAEFSTITVEGVDGQVAWQGRLETVPRASGDRIAITPGAVGWQTALQDNQNVRALIIDRDLSHWQQPSTQRQANVTLATFKYGTFQTAGDPTSGNPGLVVQLPGAYNASPIVECWYDAGPGQNIGGVYVQQTGQALPASWAMDVLASSDDIASTIDTVASFTTSPHSGWQTLATARRYLDLLTFAPNTNNTSNAAYLATWSNVAVIADHGLALHGVAPTDGFYASDIVAHIVQTWASELATSRAGFSTIEPSQFVITHLAALDPTTAIDVINQAIRFGLPDWWVDEGPTFNLASRDNHGRRWRARVGPSGLSEAGPQVDRAWNSVVVQYQDVSGLQLTAGPPGSGADTEDAGLADSDPQNPCTLAGLSRRAVVKMGISTPSNAILLGAAFLQEQKLLSTAGQATLTGFVEAADTGVICPAWMVRAGDQVSFLDAHDPSFRRIVRSEYSDAARACQITLDSPPDGLDSLLQRLSAVLQPLGMA